MITDLLSRDVQSAILRAAIVRSLLVISSHTTVQAAVNLMNETGLSCALVVEGEESQPKQSDLIGVLTEQAIIRCLSGATLTAQPTDLDQLPVHSIMQDASIALHESALTEIQAALVLFQHHCLHHLPILDANHHIVGLLAKDVLAQQCTEYILQLGSTTIPERQAERNSTQAALLAPSFGMAEERLELQTSTLDKVGELGEVSEKLAEKCRQYRELFDLAPDGYLVTNPSGIIQAANQTIANQLAVSQSFLVGQPLIRFVNQQDYSLIYTRINQLLIQREKQTWEVILYPQEGKSFPVEVTVVPVHHDSTAVTSLRWLIRDISERMQNEAKRHQAELLLEIQKAILEQIVKGDPLPKILEMLIRSMEEQLDQAPCSILLCDGEGNLQQGAAPHLPRAFLQAIDRIPIGEGVGSCGTAAFRGQTVVVSDIARDPLWQDLKELPLKNGLHACWSVPIIGRDQRVLGTFAVYHYEPYTPSDQEISVAVLAANIAGIAIERQRAIQTLRQLNQDLEQRVNERTVALQASEERWQLILKGTNDGIWDWDLKTHKIFFSSRWKQMRGFTDDEIGDSPDECLTRIHPDDCDRVRAAIDEHFAGKTEFFEIEYRARRKDGSYLWILDRGQALRDQSGQVIRMSGSETDISDRKQAEEALRESERRYSTLAAAAPVAIFRFDVPFNCIYVNDRWSEMTGRSKESALGRGWMESVHPDDLNQLMAQHSENYTKAPLVRAKQVINHGEGRHCRPDGSISWFYVQIAPELDAAGTITGYIGTLTDITYHKQAEIALQKSEQRYRVLLDGASDAILLADAQGNLIEVNQRAEALLGYSRDELTRLHISQIHPPEVLEAAQAHFQNILQNNSGPTLESVVLRKDGGYVSVDITASRIDLGDKQIAQGIFRDTSERVRLETERKKAENALYESQQFLETVLDSFPLTVFWKDRNSVYLGCNRNLLRDLGLKSDSEIIGKTDYDFFPNRIEADAYRADDQQVMDINQAKLGIIATQEQTDGRQTWVETNKIPLHNLVGEVIGVLGTSQDITDRQQAELNLQKSELRFRRVFESNVVGMIFADFQGLMIDANDRFLQMIGYTRAELETGMIRWDVMTPPEHVPADFAAMEHLIQHGVIDPWEKEYYRKDGSRVSVLIGAALLPGSEDQTICVVVDIGDRKQAELALQESQRFIQQIADASPNILYLYDLQEKRNIYANREIALILGYTPEEIQAMGDKFTDLLHPDDLETVFPDYLERLAIAQDGETSETEYRVKHANGEWHWLYSRDSVFSRDAEGRVKLVIGTAQDISDRKRLQQEQDRLIALLEASTDYILMTDVTGAAIWNNAALKQLCGLNDTAIQQQGLSSYYPQWSVEMLEQMAIPDAIAHGSWLGENILLDVNGQEIPVSQLLLAHTSPQGKVEFFSTIMRDMRVHKEYEQRLEQTNAALLRATRLKDEFLANMSHELRTPLNAILGMAEGLQEQVFGPLNERQLKALRTIDRSGSHLLELINDILDVAKIEAGQIDLKYTPTSIPSLCQSSLAFIKQQTHQKNIQLEVKLPDQLPGLIVDERRIRQVLINLLNNAMKFTPEAGKITLEVSSQNNLSIANPGPKVRFAVIDTGIGIAPEHLKKLFQPFIQIDSALNRQYAGTGLGLALVKQIVELHGGSVHVTSELGVGSCFMIDLPCAPDPSVLLDQNVENQFTRASLSERATADEAPQVPLILIAEDNEANISTVSSYLEAKGYRIVLARDGQAAIEMAKAHQPDLILMDIQMPGMDGLEAIRQIRTDLQLNSMPIIALTALAMTGDREKCLAGGANDYLTKPVKLKQLVITIQHHLAETKAAQ